MGSDDKQNEPRQKVKKKKVKKQEHRENARSRSRGRSRHRSRDRRRARSVSTAGRSSSKAVLTPADKAIVIPDIVPSATASGSKPAAASNPVTSVPVADDQPAQAEPSSKKMSEKERDQWIQNELKKYPDVAAVRQAKLEGRLFSTRWADDSQRQSDLKKQQESQGNQAATAYNCEVCGRHVGGGSAGSYQHKRSAFHLAAWIYWKQSRRKPWSECVTDGNAWSRMLQEQNAKGPDDSDVKVIDLTRKKGTESTDPVQVLVELERKRSQKKKLSIPRRCHPSARSAGIKRKRLRLLSGQIRSASAETETQTGTVALMAGQGRRLVPRTCSCKCGRPH